MKQKIEAALQPLLGEPLTDMWRYGCQVFDFGQPRPAKNRKGHDITISDWALVVTGKWQITGPGGSILSSDDFGPDSERRDEKAKPFYELMGQHPPRVENLQADDSGGVVLSLTDGYTIKVLSESRDGDELWRFMPKQEIDGKPLPHFVVTVSGIEEPVE